MPELNWLELQGVLTDTNRILPIVFIPGRGDLPTSARAMKAGATGFLSKLYDEEDLLEAIRRALDKGRQQSLARAASDEVRRRLATLTRCEYEVLLQVLAGHLTKQIAAARGVAEKTIQVHRGRVMQKMQVQSVADLVRLCQKAGVRVP